MHESESTTTQIHKAVGIPLRAIPDERQELWGERMTTWRYRCPEGHVSWTQRSNSVQACQEPKSEYYCESCKAAGDDPHFEELIDLKHQDL